MIPFFVLDRPNGLTIIRKAITSPSIHFGIMTHVRVSERFVSESNALREEIRKRFGFSPCLIVDSGTFIRNHKTLTEIELFDRYEAMRASHGIVNDILGDSKRTIANCSNAIHEYLKSHRNFKLVGVAQGRCLDEYLMCYNELARMGYRHIAVGGLLQKKPRSVRFTQVKNGKFMQQVLSAIRVEFNPDWLYVLGAYHPKRHESFRDLGIWGSDYKGWLFRYPSIFEGLLALSERASETFLTSIQVKRIKRIRGMISNYSYYDPDERGRIRMMAEALHAELWRSEAIVRLLRRRNLPNKEYRILRAVFWQSLTKRREAGILQHLRAEVFPAIKADWRDRPGSVSLDC